MHPNRGYSERWTEGPSPPQESGLRGRKPKAADGQPKAVGGYRTAVGVRGGGGSGMGQARGTRWHPLGDHGVPRGAHGHHVGVPQMRPRVRRVGALAAPPGLGRGRGHRHRQAPGVRDGAGVGGGAAVGPGAERHERGRGVPPDLVAGVRAAAAVQVVAVEVGDAREPLDEGLPRLERRDDGGRPGPRGRRGGGGRRRGTVVASRLAVVGGWRLVAAGGWWLAVGGWRRLAVGGGWRLAVGGPLGQSLRAVRNKKKI